jgi:hypothetical protein
LVDSNATGAKTAARIAAGAANHLPAELEHRIALLEAHADDSHDFDAASWVWLVLLGIVLPVVLLCIGWAL